MKLYHIPKIFIETNKIDSITTAYAEIIETLKSLK